MINFEKIIFKNILSAGNFLHEISLNEYKKTVIYGKSGDGKSTIEDAITFALYGKSFRKIVKSNLVNSYNKKDLFTEIHFNDVKHKYIVKRGMKPNIFTIIKDGEEVKELPNAIDQQKYLEEEILKINYSAFKQMVILGSSTHTPFMELKADERRNLVETLLDLDIFSIMNSIVKEEFKNEKNKKRDIESSILEKERSLKDLKDVQKKNIEERKDRSKEINDKIKILNDEIVKITELKSVIDAKLEKIDLSDFEKKFQKINEKISTLEKTEYKDEDDVRKSIKTLTFFEKNNKCTLCDQIIDKKHKDVIIKNENNLIEKRKERIEKIQESVEKLKKQKEKVKENISMINSLFDKQKSYTISIESKTNHINILTEQLVKRIEVDSTIQDKINYIENEIKLANKNLNEVLENIKVYEILIMIMKDNGIKSIIIKKYIPLINKYINEYLEKLNIFAKFTLDEEFNESIKSRYLDNFTYENFSTGEKNRISLAIFLAFRKISAMKNSLDVNLIFFDELLEKLDGENALLVVNLLKTIEDKFIFLITHNQSVIESSENSRTDRTIKVMKEGNFTTYKEMF